MIGRKPRALFPDGEDEPPRLADKAHQGHAMNELANAYSLSGQPRRAVSAFELAVGLAEELDKKRNVAIGLGNLAIDQIRLGELAAAERNLRREYELYVQLESERDQAENRIVFGRLQAYLGRFQEAEETLQQAIEALGGIGSRQAQGLIWAYRTLRALLLGDAGAALEAARRARKLADVARLEIDVIWAEWLLGWALTALARPGEAEPHLSEALSRCRRINMVDHEPDILLAWTRWHLARSEAEGPTKGNWEEARQNAAEALAIAERCEYRLVQADVHNFLAGWHLEGGDTAQARRHAELAKERARCDGPPHCYRVALDEAERLLGEIDKT